MPPEMLRVRSFAKINLGLAVGPRRSDGFHALATVYGAVDLGDTLELRFDGERGFRVETDDPTLPTNAGNIVGRALEALRPFMRRPVGISVFLRKRVPDGAGLGGGSGDAAATLLAVNRALRLNIPPPRMHALAAALGSDVPFFLAGGAALGIGRGEILCPLPRDVFGRKLYYALAVPEQRLPTAEVYRLAADMNLPKRENVDRALAGVLRAVETTSWRALDLRNDLEPAAMRLAPAIGALKRALGEGAVMTGSGSGVFALFDSLDDARRAARRAKEAVPSLRLAHAGRWLGSLGKVRPHVLR